MAMLGTLCGLGAWVCSILVGVQAIKRQQVGMGVLCIICSLAGLIFGWTKANEWGLKNLMVAFTILFALGVILSLTFRVSAGV